MSKLATVAAAGIGGTGVVFGGAYLSGAFSGIDDTLPTKVDDLKQDSSKGCVGYLFPKLSLESSNEISDSKKAESSYFDSEKNKKGSACLTVNGEKEKFSDNSNPGKGNFRWLGSFVQGEKGLIMFTVASESSTEKQLDLTGIVYLIKRDKGVGIVDKYKNINSSKKINKTDFDKSFPKSEAALKDTLKDISTPDYWGFVSNENDMENVCKTGNDSSCKTQSEKSSFRGLGLMKSFDDSKSEMKKWSSNIDTLLPDLYTTSDLVIKDAVASMKGEGKLYSFVIK